MKRKAKWIWRVICISAIVSVILVVSFHEAILLKAGRFMAPEVKIEDTADIVILEGEELVSIGMVSKGMQLLSSGKARRMVVVLMQMGPNYRPFAFNDEDYPLLVRTELQRLGLKDSASKIVVTHNHEPVTIVSARDALEVLYRDGVRSAILVSPGFRMRRSFLVYQYLSAPLNIKIYPVACFDAYELNNWWNQDEVPRYFLSEVLELMFYMIKGYIPLKFSY